VEFLHSCLLLAGRLDTTWVAFRRSLVPPSSKQLYRHDTNTREGEK
jgi:hypothetical protein